MEKDRPRDGLSPKLPCHTWNSKRHPLIGVWSMDFSVPIKNRGENAVFEDVAKLVEALSEGGRVVTACTILNLLKWISMTGLWKTLDSTFGKFAGSDQLMPTARNMIVGGRMHMEGGSEREAHVEKSSHSVVIRRFLVIWYPIIVGAKWQREYRGAI